ncbi:unnamed protein product [Ilex paraguariensis]|uniref:Glycosyltransferase N-terminal domain-containing protein n=1 Tax=Ilex paraguariensis TaxID=185542 RepID=A0ABC8UMX7_9AQUA
MVPLPAQGHLNQLLHLARLISSYGIPVHFVGTTTHNRQAKLRIHGWDPLATTNIHFHEFPTPSFPSLPPDPNASFPSHMVPLLKASMNLREPVGTLLRTLSAATKRVIVIHDSLMASVVQDVPSIPSAESYCFRSISAFATSLFRFARRKTFPIDAEILKEAPSIESCSTSEFWEFRRTQLEHRIFNSGNLCNTSRVIEDRYIDMLAQEQVDGTSKHWAIGPFNPVDLLKNKNSIRRHSCLEWLDKQNKRNEEEDFTSGERKQNRSILL